MTARPYAQKRFQAVSLPQPLASLAARGAAPEIPSPEPIEPGAMVALHAANRFEPDIAADRRTEAERRLGQAWQDNVPLNAVVGIGRVVSCAERHPSSPNARGQDPAAPRTSWLLRLADVAPMTDSVPVAGNERAVWMWRPGRGQKARNGGQIDLL